MPSCFAQFCNITYSNYSEIQSSEEIGRFVTVAAAASLVNGIVFLLFLLKAHLRTASNYFLLSLAVSDCSVGVVVIPMGLLKRSVLNDNNPELDKYFPIVQAVYHVLERFIAFSTVYHVTAITLDRYLAVINPMKHYLLRKSTALKVILGIWFAAFGISCVQFSWNLEEPQNEKEDEMQYLHERNYYIFCIINIFVIPYMIMLFAYGSMFRKIFAAKKSEQKYGALRRHSSFSRRSDKKQLIIFLLLAIIFAICWLPWFSFTLYFLSGGVLHQSAYTISALVRFLTPVANPIMYTVFKRDFKDALESLLKGRFTSACLSLRANSNCTLKTQTSKNEPGKDVLPLKVIQCDNGRGFRETK